MTKQISILSEEWKWVDILSAYAKELACGYIGRGAMRDWTEIVAVIEERLANT